MCGTKMNDLTKICIRVLDCFKKKNDHEITYCSPVIPPQVTWVPADKYDELRSAALELVTLVAEYKTDERTKEKKMDFYGYDNWKTSPPEEPEKESIYTEVLDMSDKQLLEYLLDIVIQLDEETRNRLREIVYEQKADEEGIL